MFNEMTVKFVVDEKTIEFNGDRDDLLIEGGKVNYFIENMGGFNKAAKNVVEYWSRLEGSKWWETSSEFIFRSGLDHPYSREIIKKISLKKASNIPLNSEEEKVYSRYSNVINHISINVEGMCNDIINREVKKLKEEEKIENTDNEVHHIVIEG